MPIIIVVLHHAAQRLLGRDRAKHSRKCAHYETIAPKGLHFEAQTLQGIELMPQILRFLRRQRDSRSLKQGLRFHLRALRGGHESLIKDSLVGSVLVNQI